MLFRDHGVVIENFNGKNILFPDISHTITLYYTMLFNIEYIIRSLIDVQIWLLMLSLLKLGSGLLTIATAPPYSPTQSELNLLQASQIEQQLRMHL